MGRKVAIVGSRGLRPRKQIFELLVGMPGDTVVVSGGARGVDSVAEEVAKELRLRTEIYLAEWEKHGRAAGYIRNRQIAEASDEMYAYWDGRSRGTYSSIHLMKSLKKPVTVVRLKS